MKARRFLPIESFATPPRRYELLPFRFATVDGQELVVGEAGAFMFVPTGTVRALVRGTLPTDGELYRALKSRRFLTDDASGPLLDVLATQIRTKRASAVAPTALHIFVVTLRCDHSCHYCQVSRQTESRSEYDMTLATADRAVDLMLASPVQRLTMEFQGGEPLLAFDTICAMVERAERGAAALKKDLEVVIVTNLSHIDDEKLAWLRDHGVMVSTSLDGPAELHNANRSRPGNDSYERAVRGIDRVRDALGRERVAALMTTTKRSLAYPEAIVDEYARLDLGSIFVRPLSPYGFALRTRRTTGYTIDEFLAFYDRALARVLEVNARGVSLTEAYATLLLTKILTPFSTGYVDLQSPAGAGLGVLVYNYDGDVYASDESRMLAESGDRALRLGNVLTDDRRALMESDAMRLLAGGAVHESLPGCETCVYQSYCGADPVFHYATQGDPLGHRPTSDFCRRNMHTFKVLFAHIARADTSTERVLWSWIRGRAHEPLEAACA